MFSPVPFAGPAQLHAPGFLPAFPAWEKYPNLGINTGRR
jgi:hypothetical protein